MPSGITSTGWPAVRDRCLDLGIRFDSWQDGIGRLALAKRDDGKYAATVGGVVMSIPRQVGKTYLVGGMVFALCILNPGMTVIWTAHRTRTAAETFRSMQGFARRTKIKPYIENVYMGSGDEEVRFRNGSRILFGARERGFGRGFAAVDIIVFDEAQILTENALDDMVAATNRAAHPAGALLFYMGTPPRPVDPGEVFSGKRDRALAGTSADTVYVELSADSDAKPDDRKQWAIANPSYPVHTPVESLMRLRENLGSDESYLREAMGVWDEPLTSNTFGAGAWQACCGPIPDGYEVGSVGVAVAVNLASAAISLGARAGERVVPLPSHHAAGTEWVVDAAVAVAAEHRVPIIVDGGGPTAFLVPELKKQARRKGIRVVEMSLPQMKDACAAIFQQVITRQLLHGSWPELDVAVAGAVRRDIGDRWLWGRRGDKKRGKPGRTVDISPLEAATVALWGQDNVRTRSSVDQRLAEGQSAVLSI